MAEDTREDTLEHRTQDDPSVITPRPDPTIATNAALERALKAERDYVDLKIAVLEERLDGIDVATRLLNETVNRVPTEVTREIRHLKELTESKFLANRTAIEAALTAQQQAIAKQDTANEKAIDKADAAYEKRFEEITNRMMALESKLLALIDRNSEDVRAMREKLS